MSRYTFPNAYAEEQAQNEGPIQGAATGFGGLQVVTAKGPAGIPLRHRTFEAWKKVFGDREVAARGDGAYEAKCFFDEGGFELITVRQVHYADLTDKTSFTGGVANRTASTDAVGAEAAEKVTTAAPFVLDAGDDIDLDVDNAGVAAATFAAAAGSVVDTTTYAVPDQDGLTVGFKVNGGVTQIITFSGVTTTRDSVRTQINAGLVGARAVDTGAQFEVISDTQGTGSSIEVVAGTSALTFAAATAGTGDVADIKAVTIAEFKLVVENDTTAEVTDNGDGTATISSPTAGATSELDFQSGTALIALGLSVEVITGTAAGATFSTLKMEAGYHGSASPGVEGNTLKTKVVMNPRKASAGVGLDVAADITASDTEIQVTSHAGIVENSVIKVWDGTNTEYKIVSDVRTVVASGTVSFYIDVENGFTNGFTAASAQLQSMEFNIEVYIGSTNVETLLQNSMLDVSDDYVVTKVNDESVGSQYIVVTDLNAVPPGLGADTPAVDAAAVALTSGTDEILGMTVQDWIGDTSGKTGLFAWDEINEFMPFCTPGMNEASVVAAADAYATQRMWFEYLTYVDEGMSSEDAVSFRNNIIGLNTSHTSMYAGGMKVYDPIGTGSNPRRSISGLGFEMGLRSRVDDIPSPNGGPWESPAGEGEYGDSRSALDVATKYTDTESGNMNDAGINVIRKFGITDPVRSWGSRTLDSSPKGKFKYIATRRFFQYAEKSIVESTRWAVHRNNNYRLWGKLDDRVDTWLKGLMPDGAFPTPIKEKAFFVKVGVDAGTMDQQNIDDGEVIGEIGLAPNKPGEFIIFRFSQFDSGWDVLETP